MATSQLPTVVRHLRRLAGERPPERGDGELLRAFLDDRDQIAFEAIVRRHGPMVLQVCRRAPGNEADAEDAFQATFLVLAQQAASIRKRASLASWLHGVAHRMATNQTRAAARRRKHEQQAGAARAAAAEPAAVHELQAVLDEEIGQLAEIEREPFVLCCLEQRSCEEAAGRLGLAPGTVANRLSRARKALRERLARRGVSLGAVLAVTALTGRAVASVPKALLSSTVQAAVSVAGGQAVTGLVPAAVVALVEGVNHTMRLSKIKSVMLAVLAIGLAGAGLMALARASAPPAGKMPAEKGPPAKAKAAEDGKVGEITARVLRDDGKPFAGAEVSVWAHGDTRPGDTRATSGEDGRFRLKLKPAERERQVLVVARAKGYVPDWAAVRPGARELTLRLSKADVPIEGRVLDLEGKPIAGATVSVRRVDKPADGGDLKAWIDSWKPKGPGEQVKRPAMVGLVPGAAGLTATATTGKDGKFRLSEIGRERVAYIDLEGSGIESTSFNVLTRAGANKVPIEYPVTYSAKFKHLAGPSKPIIGTVRDKKTGKALAGIAVGAAATPGGEIGGHKSQRTVTDKNGKYRINGVGKHEQYYVAAQGVPYFNVTKLGVKDTEGLAPITVDFELERGVTLRGKLTDKVTGKAVAGSVFWRPLPDNPNLKDYGTAVSLAKVYVTGEGNTVPDRSFELAAVPGPGVLLVHARDDAGRYRRAADAEDDELLRDAVRIGTHTCRHHAILRVSPSEKKPASLKCDIALEPGVSRKGTVLGPDGKPLAGALAGGVDAVSVYGAARRLETADFTITGLHATRARTVMFYHKEKKLAAVVQVKGDKKDPVKVRLAPLPVVTGRLVDAKGRPVAAAKVIAVRNRNVFTNRDLPLEFLSGDGAPPQVPGEVKTDDRGNFRIEGLVPGTRIDMAVAKVGIVRGLYVKPNVKTVDLGDVKLSLKE